MSHNNEVLNIKKTVTDITKNVIPGIEKRVDSLEKKQHTIDNVKDRVDKIEADICLIKEKVSAMFNDMRKELTKQTWSVASIVGGSLFLGLIAMVAFLGPMFGNLNEAIILMQETTNQRIEKIKEESNEAAHCLELELNRLEIKIDTTKNKRR